MSDYQGWPSPLEDETGFDFTCKYCEQKFESKWSLMNHRKEIHSNIVNVCKHILEDKVNFLLKFAGLGMIQKRKCKHR